MPHTVELSNPDKVLIPDAGLTKAGLAAHYERVAPFLLPHIRERPLSFQVHPAGISKPGHFLKQAPDYFPDWVHRLTVPKKGGTVDHVIADDVDTLVLLANHNAITPHMFTSRAAQITRPDRLVVDLDPESAEDFARVRASAKLVGDIMRGAGLEPFAMVTGSTGLHVWTPIAPELEFPEALALAKRIAEVAVDARPDDLTTAFHKADRGGRIFVDVLRNRWAQTVVPPYAVRTKPEASVSVPLRWDELASSRLAPRRWTVANIGRRLGRVGDPWEAMDQAAASPRAAQARL